MRRQRIIPFRWNELITAVLAVLLGPSLLLDVSAASSTRAVQVFKDFYPPIYGGGYELMSSNNGYGEPLNVIVSSESSPEVLTDEGFLNWVRSLGFSYECLGMHKGGKFKANLGDGNGWTEQLGVFRESYDVEKLGIGTCLETLVGGNHFRLFRQDGPRAKTGALFLAASHEENLDDKHDISPDGYDLGRDELVARATKGVTEYDDVMYQAKSQDLYGLFQEGTMQYINHNISIDGVVKLLTVQIVGKDD